MSVFRVKLNNASQGTLDVGTDGTQNAVSSQRSVYLTGPNLKKRLLKDGDEFTDCNYWKQFCYPAMSHEFAYLEVVEDDGSVYDAGSGYPRVWNIEADGSSTYEDNQADILTDTGSHAVFCQITNMNTDDGDDVQIRLNGLTNAVFDLKAGQSQVFNPGDLAVTLIEVDNSVSGSNDVVVQIIASVASSCTS